MGGWRIWWIYNRLLYWFRFGFGKVIRVWWHSFNSSDSFPIGFSKKFKISVRSIDIIHLPMKISILEQNLKFSQILGGSYSRNYEEIMRLWNNLQSAGNAFSLDSIDDVITWFWLYQSWLWSGFPSFISSFINKPAYFINIPTLKWNC